MAPPPSPPAVSPLLSLIIRVLTLLCLLISVIVLATSPTIEINGYMIKFNFYYAYSYVLAAGLVGIAYTLLQTSFTIYFVSTGNRLGGDGWAFVDFYGDKALSYLLATGAAAGLAVTMELSRDGSNDFLHKADLAASLLFFGFIFSAVSSIFSSFSLPKRPS